MSQQRTPLRSRSSLANFSTAGMSTPLQQTTKPRATLTELRRPPSSRTMRPASPRMTTTRSRPSSAMGNLSSGSSRPTTPSFVKQVPYTGTITVSIRPNPHSFNPAHSPWEIEQYSNTINNRSDSVSYSFDKVFPPESALTNREVYYKSCSPIVNKFLNEGFNGTIFAYGMTGSGKTFSMKGSDQDPGFVKLSIDDIFSKIENERGNKQFSISITYLEIYNEKIVDLLNTSYAAELKIRDDPVYGTKIVGITSPTISSKEQLLLLIKKGDNNRKTSATDFNARSSRSHSILQIKLNTIDLLNSTEQNSTLSLCDLAGSERATSSLERRKEGSYINKSLLALSTVINKLSLSSSGLSSPNTGNDHIPYRDSKLTRLLQPALSGSSLVLILCTIHLGSLNSVHSQQFISETYNTLRFAARAKDIVINVNKNQQSSIGGAETARLIEELKKTIENQKNEISMLKLHSSDDTNMDNNSAILEKNMKIAQVVAENQILTEKLEHLTRLNDLQKTETIILRNDTLNDLLGTGIDNLLLQVMMANLEEFYKRVNYEIDECKSYIGHLENQLKVSHQQNAFKNDSNNGAKEHLDKHMDAVLKDQEEEILHLKELLKDKDHVIKSLTKTTKLRKLIDSNYNDENKQSNIINDSSDKENFSDLKEFNINLKKPHVSLDIY